MPDRTQTQTDLVKVVADAVEGIAFDINDAHAVYEFLRGVAVARAKATHERWSRALEAFERSWVDPGPGVDDA